MDFSNGCISIWNMHLILGILVLYVALAEGKHSFIYYPISLKKAELIIDLLLLHTPWPLLKLEKLKDLCLDKIDPQAPQGYTTS